MIQTFRIIFLEWWKKLIVTGVVIVGIYDLIVAQFIRENAQEYFPNLADDAITLGWPWWIWVIILLSIACIFLIQNVHTLRLRLIGKLGLAELNELRTIGIEIKNRGTQLMDIGSVPTWIQSFRDWEDKVVLVIIPTAPDRLGWFKAHQTFTARKYPTAFTAEHQKMLQVFDEKLRRLEIIIEELPRKEPSNLSKQ